MILPALVAGVGLWAISDRRHELLAGGPVLGLAVYSIAVAVFGRTDTEVDERGFRLSSGPLPSGVRDESHGTEAIRALFPREIRESVGKGAWENRYYAAVELRDGRWVNVMGPYADWKGASAACLEIGPLWRLPVIAAGRVGFPPGRDWAVARIAALWGGAFVAALLWGLAVEVSGAGR